MLKTKVITQYTDRNLEKAVNAFLAEREGLHTVLSIEYAAQEDFYSALILYQEPPLSEEGPAFHPL